MQCNAVLRTLNPSIHSLYLRGGSIYCVQEVKSNRARAYIHLVTSHEHQQTSRLPKYRKAITATKASRTPRILSPARP